MGATQRCAPAHLPRIAALRVRTKPTFAHPLAPLPRPQHHSLKAPSSLGAPSLVRRPAAVRRGLRGRRAGSGVGHVDAHRVRTGKTAAWPLPQALPPWKKISTAAPSSPAVELAISAHADPQPPLTASHGKVEGVARARAPASLTAPPLSLALSLPD